MIQKHRSSLLLGGIYLSLSWASIGCQAAVGYILTDLGSNAWYYSEAHGLNGSGVVVGEFEPTNALNVQAFLYQAAGFTDLGHLGGIPYAVAYGINDTNQAVGESDTGNETHAFLYANGLMTDLGTLAGQSGYGSAHAINRGGEIAGESSVSFSQVSTIHAVLYSGASKKDLGALGANYSSASALNNHGVIAGESDVVQTGVTNVHAFVYTNGVSQAMTDLGTLGGPYSSAKGVNDSGVVVGEADALLNGANYTHAFIWRDGVMTDLGTFGGASSSASAINSAGKVVGYATDANEVSRAFLYDGAAMQDLNEWLPPGSDWTNLASADAINDAGQIAGSGYLADGSYHAYLLSPSNGWVALAAPVPQTNGQLALTVQGMTGEAVAVLVSTNLTDWAGLSTNTLTSSSVVIYDTPAPESPCRFYRALLLP